MDPATIPAEVRRKPAQIKVPYSVSAREYEKYNLKTFKRLGTKRGGTFADGVHFRYQGGQVRSMASVLSYLGTGEYSERYHGLKIPPTNVQDYHLDTAKKFAGGLADRLASAAAAK